ncbi:nitronate monooxygenase [Arthrobacter sp. 08Y14]|uniref:nitronate monooxygenase n=1 Tax=Arthrobacter sp. 08Y14 TaxID=2058885 RepID=UPI000CE4D987|nr:nitronate monooxygenase [Arthrobacter sp. 08Y14]
MFTLNSLALPVIGAPMAGGPSTPELAAAVGEAGGLGFLAAGYKSTGTVADQITQLRRLSGRPFGLNLFVPDAANTYPVAAQDQAAGKAAARARKIEAALIFREHLVTAAGQGPAGTTVPEPGMPNPNDDDAWQAKLELVLRERVPVVSFTFGLPEPAVFAELAAQGICSVVTVTDAGEARAAAAAGANVLCVQGPEAGGHRGTLDSGKVPGKVSLTGLLDQVREACPLPLVAAGGISTPEDASAALAAGAGAVQVGTLLLLSDEAGTSKVHRGGLMDAVQGRRDPDTSLTRAFSGRPARGLVNDFMRAYPDAPDAYPYINHITGPLRADAAAAGNPEGVSLWAGTGFRHAAEGPAPVILRRLFGLAD